MTNTVQLASRRTKELQDLQKSDVFGNFEKLIVGWYWGLPSRELKRGQIKAISLFGRDLIFYRGDDGEARIMDAYCPHMGAHLAEGRVDGNGVRCFFHHWKFEADGTISDCPIQEKPPSVGTTTWPAAEKYGVIWIWTGDTPKYPVPFIPELKDVPERAMLGNNFTKGCHPNIVMINAIDEQHFHSVHPAAASLANGLHFEISSYNDNCQMFDNSNEVPETNFINRLLSRFYAKALTYRMVYWNGSTGSVTIGPDFWHFHIVFALRPTGDGTAEGQTILVTNKHSGIIGYFIDKVSLILSHIVGSYFAEGDTRVFQSIKWDFKTPIKADRPIIQFQKHLAKQEACEWGSWEPLNSNEEASDDPSITESPELAAEG